MKHLLLLALPMIGLTYFQLSSDARRVENATSVNRYDRSANGLPTTTKTADKNEQAGTGHRRRTLEQLQLLKEKVQQVIDPSTSPDFLDLQFNAADFGPDVVPGGFDAEREAAHIAMLRWRRTLELIKLVREITGVPDFPLPD